MTLLFVNLDIDDAVFSLDPVLGSVRYAGYGRIAPLLQQWPIFVKRIPTINNYKDVSKTTDLTTIPSAY